MILDRIIENKKIEVEARKKNFPLSNFKSKIKKSDKSFKSAIKKSLGLIAELKRASPSEGLIRKDFNIEKIITIYDTYAQAISVLTDKRFFSGDIKFINEVRKYTGLPILRKDFIIDEYQIYESRYYGADAILLIASILTKNQIDKFISIAKKLNVDCLVEVHTEDELMKVLKTKTEIIGINNRNLSTMNINLNNTLRLIKKIPKNKIIVSESGFKFKEDIDRVKNKVNSVLIGTALMKERDIEKKIKEFTRTKVKICGITNEKDAINAVELGAEFIGLIVEIDFSKDSVSRNEAKRIIKKLPADCNTVFVTYLKDSDKIVKIAKSINPKLIQLHNDISIKEIIKLKKRIPKIKIIKAVHVTGKEAIKIATHYSPYVDYILLDTKTKNSSGGTGKIHDWSISRKIVKSLKKPVFLAGGLNPDNVQDAIKTVSPFAVDTNNGVKSKDRKKDFNKMKSFIEGAK